jgi:type IV pilus assembly protein PilB
VARIRIGDLLVKAQLIDEMQLQSALAHQRQWGGKLGDILVTNGFLDEMMLWRGLSKQLGVQLVSLPDERFVPGIEKQVPLELCEKHQVVPVLRDDKGLTLATSDPNNLGGIDEVAFRTGTRLRVVLAPDREVEWAIRRLYHGENTPCPPPRFRRAPQAPIAAPAPPQSVPAATQALGRDTHTPLAQLAAVAAVLGGSSSPPAPAPPAGPWWNQPTASDAEVAIRETAHLLRFLVEVSVQRGWFTREEYLARLRGGR